MFLEGDDQRPHSPGVGLLLPMTLGDVELPRDVQLVLYQLPHSPLAVAGGPVLLHPIEDEIVPGVGVQLPGLLLQVLHHPGDVGQFAKELLVQESVLLPAIELLEFGW